MPRELSEAARRIREDRRRREPFTSPTGQRGLDAYLYEAARIANAQRKLDANLLYLIKTVRDEHPEYFEYESDWAFLGQGRPTAESFAEYIKRVIEKARS